jgi:hypothetical protein
VGDLKGLRSARVARSMRIINAVCEECRKHDYKKSIGCSSEIRRFCELFVRVHGLTIVHERHAQQRTSHRRS